MAEQRGRVAGKVALVTGAAEGIGLATARLLVAEGAAVVLGDVARAIVFLASDDAGFITGAALDANGGVFMA